VTPTGRLDPEQRLLAAQATQRQTEALRAEPTRQAEFAGLAFPQETPTPFLFDVPLVPATGRPTETFIPFQQTPSGKQPKQPQVLGFQAVEPSENIFDISFGQPTPKKKPKIGKGKRPKRQQTGFGFDFGAFELGGGISLGEAFEESGLFEPFR